MNILKHIETGYLLTKQGKLDTIFAIVKFGQLNC